MRVDAPRAIVVIIVTTAAAIVAVAALRAVTRDVAGSVAVVVHVAGTGGSHSARPSAATAAILRHLNAHSAPPDILAVAATHGVLRITLVLEGLRAGRRWKGMMRD